MQPQKKTSVRAIGATALTVAALSFVPFGGAGAAGATNYSGFSGGTQITAVGMAISSDLTAKSSITTTATTASNSNSTASVVASTLLNTGAVTSSETVSPVSGGGTLVSKAKVLGVSALGGIIRATAIETTSTATLSNGATSGDSSTNFVDLHITGVNLPVNINKNTTVTIPNIATVILNASRTLPDPDGSLRTAGTGLYIKLLAPYGGAPAGAQVWVTPTYAAVIPALAGNGLPAGGLAYGTRITSEASSSVQVNSGPTAYLGMPRGGTNDAVLTNNTAAVNLPGAATLGAVGTTAQGLVSDSLSTSKMTVAITKLSLLNGMITADALTGEVSASKASGAALVSSLKTTFVNLVIAGNTIPIDVAPNTVINIANVAKVTVNAQLRGSSGAAVELLDVQITTATLGLPVGAHIYVGVAVATIVLS